MITDKAILKPVRAFLMTYPYKTPYNDIQIDYGQVDRSDTSGEGNALRLTNRVKVRERKSVTGRITQTWRVNFSIVMWRDTNDNEIRCEISEYVLQLIEWVDSENRKRGTNEANPLLPMFSDTEKEKISADGGGATATLPNGRTEFQVFLHIEFDKQK